MQPEFWLDRWQNDELGWHMDEVNPHLKKHYSRLDLSPGQRVFVPLCGKSLDMFWLNQEKGLEVVGIDLAEKCCQVFFSDHNLTPEVTRHGDFVRYQVPGITLWCGDVFDLSADMLGPVDAIWDRAALVALPPAMRKAYAGQLLALTPNRPPMLCWTLEYDQNERKGPPFAVDIDEVAALFGRQYHMETLSHEDALANSPKYRHRGYGQMMERILLLGPAQ